MFTKIRRSFSHGCIRVEHAEELAHYLVTGLLNKRSEKIQAAVASGQAQTIRLSNPVMIYITYFTAEGRNGKLVTYDDLYHCDSKKDQ